MPHSVDSLERQSQLFTFARRDFLQKAASVALPFLVLRTQPQHGQPPFAIGDKVADHWIDGFGIEQIEYGEVMGVCWHPREEVWGYLVDWTGGNMPASSYPCFDEHLIMRGDLRLVKHG